MVLQKTEDEFTSLYPLSKSTSPERMIADLEAMLIRSMALRNINRMKFVTAREWKQIEKDEWPKYERRL